MKNAIQTVAVSMVVVVVALLAYDCWVVQPRAHMNDQTLAKIMEPQNRMADAVVKMLATADAEMRDASQEARINSLTSSLQTVRSQLALYHVQHQDNYPSLENFVAQMAGRTDINGTPDANGEYGPYLHRIPENPFTGTNTIGSGDNGTSAWFYDEKTGEFRANDSPDHAAL